MIYHTLEVDKMRKQKEKHVVYGTASVGEKGQIVIPKEARDEFDIKPGDKVLVLGKEGKGIGIVKANIINKVLAKTISGLMGGNND